MHQTVPEQYPNCVDYMVTIPYIVSRVGSILVWCHMAVCSLYIKVCTLMWQVVLMNITMNLPYVSRLCYLCEPWQSHEWHWVDIECPTAIYLKHGRAELSTAPRFWTSGEVFKPSRLHDEQIQIDCRLCPTPCFHLKSFMWWILPHFSLLPCIIANTNQRMKNRVGLGTRLSDCLHYSLIFNWST